MGDQITGTHSPYLRRLRMRQVRRYLTSGTVLDFGCGTGSLAQHIDARRCVGVDIDRDSLRKARTRHPKHVFLRPEEVSQSPHQQFDPIVALAVIEYLPHPLNWLEDMKARLRSEGVVVVTTPHTARFH